MQNAKCKMQNVKSRQGQPPLSFCTLHFSSCISRQRRRGISLMEVLISIGIMAIGLVSVASLLPVGGLQVQKANIEERKAQLVLNAVRDFHVRGMAAIRDPVNFPWVTAAPNSLQPYFRVIGANKVYNPTAATGAGLGALPPVAIDPLMSSVAVVSQAAQTNLQFFPINKSTSTPPVGMPRLTLASLYNKNPLVARALADEIMVAHDDVIVNQPDDRTLPATGAVISDTSTNPPKPYARDYNGEFSWLATLTPNYPYLLPGESGNPAEANLDPLFFFKKLMGNEYTLSIVVFDRREVPRSTSSFTASSIGEEIVAVTQPSGVTVNLGGGDITIKAPTDAQSQLIRPNTWMMLARKSPPEMGFQIFKWYRILSASSDGADVQVTLAGPDWTWGPPDNSLPTSACLFDGAVAVVQRTIHLEGPSIWNQ
jgi:type II secretory pathway pseudopilin PulG